MAGDSAADEPPMPRPLRTQPQPARHSLQLAAQLDVSGDVQGIQFLSDDTLVAATSQGIVQLVTAKLSASVSGQVTLETARLWSAVHGKRFGSPYGCMGVAALDGKVVTGGQDGSVAVMDVKSNTQVGKLDGVDSSSLTDILFIKQNSLLVSNVRGQMRLVDLRAPDVQSAMGTTFVFGEPIQINSITQHASQPHIVCSGMENGSIAFWDLRGQPHPITILKGHENSSISEVIFHPQQPEHVFSCSQNGEVWHWNGTAASRPVLSQGSTNNTGMDNKCLWFNNDALKHRVNTEALMQSQHLPINSLDASGPYVVVGGDSEAIYVMSNVIM